jgi:hypothetical protein
LELETRFTLFSRLPEQSSALREVGAGIGLMANALRTASIYLAAQVFT